MKLKRSHKEGITITLPVRGDLTDDRPIFKIGGSYCISLPKLWVEMFCDQVDGKYRVTRTINGDTIIIKSRGG